MKKRGLVFFLFLIVNVSYIFSQEEAYRPGAGTRPLTKWEKKFKQIKYGDNIYQTGSNWFSVGYGLFGYNINKEVTNRNFSLAYHHRFRGMYFNAGWHFSSPYFFTSRPMDQVNDIHVGAGLRFEGRWYNVGFFIGPSFATTWTPDELNTSRSIIHHQLGAHTELQFTFKYLYDLGIGTSLYGSFNKRYQVIGIQVHLYFSNAYAGKY